jgi:antitoxin component of MazEF toxin-antitoxin module
MDVHVTARRIGNSWGFILPKEIATQLGISEDRNTLHVDLKLIPDIKELKGTFKTNKTIAELSKEIDAGWD